MSHVTRRHEQEVMENDPKTRIILYWLEKSRSQRILWLFEELNMEYEIKTYKRENMLAPEILKKIHPLGKAPIVSVEGQGMSQPLVLAESGLMVEYILDHFGPNLIPGKWADGKKGRIGGETEGWLRYRYFMHYAEGSMMVLLVVSILMNSIKNGPVPFFIKPITNVITGKVDSLYLTPNFKTHLSFLESQIATSPSGGEFLCGRELTGADIMMSFPLAAAKAQGGFTQEKYPKLWAYLERLESREAYKRAVQKIIDVEGSYDSTL